MSRTRVLFFRPALGDGGADRVTITILQHLDRSRFEPSIALVRPRGELISEVPSDVPIIDLDVPRLALSVPALARVLTRERPDVLMSTASAANIFAIAAHRLARSGARVVLSERSALDRTVGRSRLRSIIERRLKQVAYRLADQVTAVSDGVAADLVNQLKLPPSMVRVVYNPLIPPDHQVLAAAPVEDRWFAEGPPPLIAVGRLVSYKDYPTMLDAFARIRAITAARLAIFGKGALREELEAHANRLKLGTSVRFFGFDPNPFRYLARAALLLQTSTVEGLPGSIIQSMACGAPVVSTDCDHGPREVIRDDVNGYLVPVGDAAALAARALRVLDDPSLRARLSSAGVETAQKFGVVSSMRRYEAAISGASS